MSNADPITFLWRNMVALAGLGPEPSLDRMKARTGVGRGIVQRIRAAEGVELRSVVTIAEKLGVPVWRLLHPETGSLTGWSPTTLAVASKCNREEPAVQEHILSLVDVIVTGPMARASRQTAATQEPVQGSSSPPDAAADEARSSARGA